MAKPPLYRLSVDKRCAPFPSVAELETAMELFCLCAERAAVSLLLETAK